MHSIFTLPAATTVRLFAAPHVNAIPLRTILLLCFATACMSSSFYFVRESILGPAALAAYRLMLASLVTLPLFLMGMKKAGDRFQMKMVLRSVLPGIFLGLHFITWNMGCRLTAASNATLLVNLVPVALPFALFFLAKERITRGELFGTMLAIVGMFVMAIGDYNLSREHLKGDAVCAGSMLVLAMYIAFVRRNAPTFPNIWLFTVPVWIVAGITCSIFAFFWGEFDAKITSQDWYALAGLIIVPTILGHGTSILTLSLVRGQIMALFNLGQMIPASILAWFAYRELPHAAFFLAALFVVAGVVVALRSTKTVKA